jgi:hypothetical protein
MYLIPVSRNSGKSMIKTKFYLKMEVHFRHKKIIVLTKNILKIRTERLINLTKVKTKEASLLLNKDSNTKNK